MYLHSNLVASSQEVGEAVEEFLKTGFQVGELALIFLELCKIGVDALFERVEPLTCSEEWTVFSVQRTVRR